MGSTWPPGYTRVILRLYRGYNNSIRVMLGRYMDNGKENENCYMMAQRAPEMVRKAVFLHTLGSSLSDRHAWKSSLASIAVCQRASRIGGREDTCKTSRRRPSSRFRLLPYASNYCIPCVSLDCNPANDVGLFRKGSIWVFCCRYSLGTNVGTGLLGSGVM